jgi:hypothetical protein
MREEGSAEEDKGQVEGGRQECREEEGEEEALVTVC